MNQFLACISVYIYKIKQANKISKVTHKSIKNKKGTNRSCEMLQTGNIVRQVYNETACPTTDL